MANIKFEKTLTKTSFSRGLQCKKHLWFHRNEPILNEQIEKQSRVFQKIGNPILELAFSMFPRGVNCTTQHETGDKNWEESLIKTNNAISEGNTILYHPTFNYNNLLCDIHLITKKGDSWEAYIIKNATRVSEQNLIGSVYQYLVMEKAGIKISKLSFITINNKYVRDDFIDVKKLFVFRDFTGKIKENLPHIKKDVELQIKTLNLSEAPSVEIGMHCNEPRSCQFKHKCWKKEPENSVFDLVGFSKISALQLWKSGRKRIDQIPLKQELSFSQEVQRQNKKRINQPAIQEFLTNIKYPLFLVDFEAFVPAIPQFEKSKPFQLIPFLFSGIRINHKNEKPNVINHICSVESDPRREFVEKYLYAAKDAETILVYDPLTEKNILNSLSKLYPDLKDRIEDSKKRIIDLSIPFKNKDFYLPEMKGYYGMKNVLPAVSKDLDYKDLEIQSGRMAATMYQMLRSITDKDEIKKQLKFLEEYCERDTLGLLKLIEVLEATENTNLE